MATLLSFAFVAPLAMLQHSATPIAATPPLGWRSWNFDGGTISDTAMRQQIDGLARKRPLANGTLASFVDLGFVHAGVDDGWQECESYRVMPSNSSAFHGADGNPIVNRSKFPDLPALVKYAAARAGLWGGWFGIT